MARERVYAHHDPTYHLVDPADPPTPPGVPPHVTRLPGVQLQFHAEGGQVGLATGHLTDATYDEDADLSRAELVATPYHVWLDRHEVNELIRKLRRARNVTFGADE
jgi:hypothetical protein